MSSLPKKKKDHNLYLRNIHREKRLSQIDQLKLGRKIMVEKYITDVSIIKICLPCHEKQSSLALGGNPNIAQKFYTRPRVSG